jgi:hypothetical protein
MLDHHCNTWCVSMFMAIDVHDREKLVVDAEALHVAYWNHPSFLFQKCQVETLSHSRGLQIFAWSGATSACLRPQQFPIKRRSPAHLSLPTTLDIFNSVSVFGS